ncbi:hypothetical protein Tco_0200287 [Tanacetum coccineum]
MSPNTMVDPVLEIVTLSRSRPDSAQTGLGPKEKLISLFDVKDYPYKALKNKGIVDSGCTEDIIDAGDSEKEDESAQDWFVLPIWPSYSSIISPDLKTDEKREGPMKEEQSLWMELEKT